MRVAVKARGTGSALAELRQSGSMKCLFPREAPGRVTAMVLNTAGGVTGGDRLGVTAEAGGGSRLTVTTQAAERIYAAEPGETGEVVNRLRVGAGARLDWLPQETILFDRARLRRSLVADVAVDGELLAVEAVIFGRAAMGERLGDVGVADRLRVMRGGRVLFHDALRLAGDAGALMARAGLGDGAGAAATVLFVSPVAEGMLGPVRGVLPDAGGASLVREGLLVVRLLADDGFSLRRGLVPVLEMLNGSALPRSWML